MRAGFSSLMAFWMAILTMSGWCGHSPFCAHGQQTLESVANADECCDCCTPMPQGERLTQPCKCQSQCQGICIYLPSQKVHLDAEQVAAVFDFAAIVDSQAEPQASSASRWDVALDLICLEPPLRLHLLHQILLI